MIQRPFRFLHAADLHLDQPAAGLADAPEQLIDLLVDSPQQAVVRVFDAAPEQRVDFVVLAGDVIDPKRAAPRDWLLLLAQFQRLAERRIAVYWCGGEVDWSQQWPDFVHWPANVHFFPAGRIERLRHEIAGQAVCEIVGRGHDPSAPPRAYEFTSSDDDLFSIALVHADWHSSALGEIGIDYWALGGQHQRATPLETSAVAHYAGSPQGRWPAETGAHGCTLVSVDELRRIQLTPLTCDVLRWQTPRLSWTDSTGARAADRRQLEETLRHRTEELVAAAPGVAHLLTWKIAAQGGMFADLQTGGLASDLAAALRSSFGRRAPPCWTVAIETDRPEQLPTTWHEEDTIRGDFLRAASRYLAPELTSTPNGEAASSSLMLPTPAELSAELSTAWLQSHWQRGNGPDATRPDDMRAVVHEAACLGAELLSAQEAG